MVRKIGEDDKTIPHHSEKTVWMKLSFCIAESIIFFLILPNPFFSGRIPPNRLRRPQPRPNKRQSTNNQQIRRSKWTRSSWP